MLLSDLGAEVIRIDRVAPAGGLPAPLGALSGRGRRSIAIDLKQSRGVAIVLDLVADADVLLEGFRPGVAERLGLGPKVCRARNPGLVYGRITGWGQDGPLAGRAGHDINYVGLTGALHAIGRPDGGPVPPLNLVADYGGGAMFLAVGVLAALVERSRSGHGQVVDAAMVDGAALLASPIYQLFAAGVWADRRGVNMLDGGAPFYDTYETADGRYLAVGPIEPQFYLQLVQGLGLDAAALPAQLDPATWDEVKVVFRARFLTKTRDEWVERFAESDACVTPVLSLAEAPHHPHNVAREVFVEIDGVVQPAPAPRFSRTPSRIPRPPVPPGNDTNQILVELGLTEADIADLYGAEVVA
jgi:alpha-methylacyl-CoA racemase